MKFNYAFLFLLFLGINTSISATTFRVSNTPESDADFTNLLDAHAIAQNGDTLLIEGGADSYGDFVMTKRLTLIGPGYFLDENSDNAISNPAKINSITLDPTTTNDPSTGAAGSKLIGLDFGFSSFTATIRINVNDVVVQKCRVFQIRILNDTRNDIPAVGVQVIQNYLMREITANTGGTGPIVNVQILNNIFTRGLSLPDNSSGAILHNLVDGGRATLEGFVGEIRSNIFTNTSDFVLPVLPNQQISHNIAANGQLGDDNNNITTVVDNLFVEEADNSTDGKWQLKPNSLAANRAHDGTDIGPYGGAIPYVLSGQGGNPAIIFFEVEPVGTASNRLKVRIRAKSSN